MSESSQHTLATIKRVLIALGILLVVIVIAQNTQVVSLKFLFWELSMSRVVLLPLAVLIGFAVGWLTASLMRRKKESTWKPNV